MTQKRNNVDFDLYFQVKGIMAMKGTFISGIDLGYSGTSPLGKNSFSVLPGSTKILKFADSFSSINDGYPMPLTITLPTAKGSDRFISGEHARWRIKNVSVFDFNLPVQSQPAGIAAFALLHTGKSGPVRNIWFDYFEYVAGVASPIPEPSSVGMMFAGIGLLSLRLRRQRR
jgi:hypothetical protein